jgi:uncharacterized protein YjbI with pentapeptide repeats
MGQEGALPLLQFLLTQMWEEMRQGIEPIETFNRVGGIGGALANEAKKIYENLSEADQKIARSIFLRLIKVNDDKTATRRRVPLSELVTKDQNATQVKGIINQFTRPGVWILITFANEEQIEMVEVAHEAIIDSWGNLKQWLEDQRDNLRKRDKLDQAAQEWNSNQRSKDYLLNGNLLRDSQDFLKISQSSLEIVVSSLTQEFIKISANERKRNFLKSVSILMIFPMMLSLTTLHFYILNLSKKTIVSSQECERDPAVIFLARYMWISGNGNHLQGGNFCDESIFAARLPNINLSGTNFQESNLSQANLRRSVFIDSDFRGVTAANTDFSEATIVDSNFGCSEQRCAYLAEANFQDSLLENSTFQGANLERVNFQGAVLTRVDLSQAKGLVEGDLNGALICETTLPEHIQISHNRDCDSL